MATHGDVGLSQPAGSTITMKLDSITLDANSTTVHREVMVLGSPETTNALAAVLAAAPKSTDWGLAVRITGGPSTFTDMPVRTIAPSTYGDGGLFRVAQTTAADLLTRPIAPSTYGDGGLFRVAQSSAGDLNVTVAGLVAPTTLATVRGDQSSNSSNYVSVRVTNGTAFTDASPLYTHNSTADFTGASTAAPPNLLRSGAAAEGSTDHWLAPWGSSDGAAFVSMVNSTGELITASTATPSNAAMALHVRTAPSSMQSTTLSVQSSNSTVTIPIISSVANVGAKVYAYFIGASTSGNVSTFVFLSSGVGGDAGAAKNRWAVLLSSAYGAANLAIAPPAFLFRSDVNEALMGRIESASTRITATVSLSWLSEA